MANFIYDYVIVGGGTAGCVLANRLSENPENNVLLIEAGIDTTETDTPVEITDGLRPWLPRLTGKRFFWPELNIHRSAEHTGIDRELQFYEQGRILGGGSSVNMVVSNRGLPSDYDEWAAKGATGWGWNDVLPYFKKLETDEDFGHTAEGKALHGSDGPLPITRVKPSQWSKFTLAVNDALNAKGLENIEDQNGRFEDGYFPPTFTVKDGQRVSAARAYLNSAVRSRPNLQLWTETQVIRVIFNGIRAQGVEVRRSGSTIAVNAKEVILSAGALQSPALLLRAGIGPAEELTALGIPVLADRPGVGKNLWDHSSLGAIAPLTESATADAHFEEKTMHQLGIRTSSGVDPRYKSDLFIHIGANHESGQASFLVWINKPSSSGSLKLTSADPDTHAAVDFNLLSNPEDLERIKVSLRFARSLFENESLSKYGLEFTLSRFAQPTLGGPLLNEILEDNAALEKYIRTNIGGVWHASGTARIGTEYDPLAVVDTAGRVYGVTGLRVVDASIFPTIPAANTNIPTVMAAEKISDAILSGS